jgi:hypothetical protein
MDFLEEERRRKELPKASRMMFAEVSPVRTHPIRIIHALEV